MKATTTTLVMPWTESAGSAPVPRPYRLPRNGEPLLSSRYVIEPPVNADAELDMQAEIDSIFLDPSVRQRHPVEAAFAVATYGANESNLWAQGLIKNTEKGPRCRAFFDALDSFRHFRLDLMRQFKPVPDFDDWREAMDAQKGMR